MPKASYRTSRTRPEVNYRRSSSIENKLAYRRIGLLLISSIGILLVVFFFGVPFVRFVGSLSQKFAKPEVINRSEFTLPPRAPRLDYLPSHTNKNKIEIKGAADPSVTVNLSLNTDAPRSTQTQESGLFEFLNISLKEGQNSYKLVAIKEGKSSSETTGKIVFDKKPPLLEVFEPADNSFYPKNTREIKISGKTEAEAIVTINDLQAIVSQEGGFSFSLPVTAPEMKIKIVSKDQASNQNTVEKSVKVDIEPLSPESSTPSASPE